MKNLTIVLSGLALGLVVWGCSRGGPGDNGNVSHAGDLQADGPQDEGSQNDGDVPPTDGTAAPSDAPSGDGGSITVGSLVNGTFRPGLPIDGEGKPYIDYQVEIVERGMYHIDLISADANEYDPYLSLLQGGAEIASDDDSGEGVFNARIATELEPGPYTIHVTKFGTGHVFSPTEFTLTVTRQASDPSTGAGRACDVYRDCCMGYVQALSPVQGVAQATIDATRESCALIETLQGAPNAEQGCQAGLEALRQGTAAMQAMPGFVAPLACQ